MRPRPLFLVHAGEIPRTPSLIGAPSAILPQSSREGTPLPSPPRNQLISRAAQARPFFPPITHVTPTHKTEAPASPASRWSAARKFTGKRPGPRTITRPCRSYGPGTWWWSGSWLAWDGHCITWWTWSRRDRSSQLAQKASQTSLPCVW